MWALISRLIVQVLAALVAGRRRDRELKAAGRAKRSSEAWRTSMNALQRRMLPLVALALILSSCATTDTDATRGAAGAAAIARICNAWPPVTWSSRDTAETIREAKANNAARLAF